MARKLEITCDICGKTLTDGTDWTWHHIDWTPAGAWVPPPEDEDLHDFCSWRCLQVFVNRNWEEYRKKQYGKRDEN